MADNLELSHDEQGRVLDLIKLGDTEVFEAEVLPSIDVQTVLDQLRLTIKALGWTTEMSIKLRPILARQLRYAQRTRVYTEWGYTTFEEFLKQTVVPTLGKSRSLIYEIMQIADKAPSITPAEYAAVPVTNFKKLLGYTTDQAPNFHEELEKASSMSIRDFNSYTVERGYAVKGETIPVAITILATADIASMWRKLRTAQETINYCESDNDGQIFLRLIQEFAGTYGVNLE